MHPNLSVDALRGTQMGSALMHGAEREAQLRGCTQIVAGTLTTDIFRTRREEAGAASSVYS